MRTTRGLAAPANMAASPGPPPDDPDADAALLACCERGLAAWPDLTLDLHRLAEYFRARLPAEGDRLTAVRALNAPDLALACACVDRNPLATRLFEETILSRVPSHLGRMRLAPDVVAEIRQQLSERLLVGTPGGAPPKLVQYGGQGSLEGWVRIAAVRAAIDHLRTDEAARGAADEAADLTAALLPERDPELGLIKTNLRGPFVDALREALAGLSQRDRALLRFAFAEQMTPARIGAIYGVHRTTVMRWLATAQEDILSRTRARLMTRAGLSAAECDAAFGLVQSRLELTLSSLLRP